MKPHSSKLYLSLIFLLLISTLLIAGCLSTQSPKVELKVGLTPKEVRRVLGQPTEIKEFVMPQGSFFGPQEALSGLVPAGSLVDEWQYESNDEVMYLWFYGNSTEEKDAWRLIATTTASKDAIY